MQRFKFLAGCPASATWLGFHTLKEERHRDAQGARKLEELACTNAIGTILVFLDLLKCDASCFP